MAENKVTPDVVVPEVAPAAPAAEPTPAIDAETTAPTDATTPAVAPAETAETAVPKKEKKSPLDFVKKFLAKFKKEKKTEPAVTA